MKNREESSKFMLLQIDLDEDTKQIMPSAPHWRNLVDWKVKPERHHAYATMWKYVTFVGIFANTTLWLYF